MLRIGQVEATATQDGKYTDGSVAGGIAATRLRAAAFNAMQEELAHIVESAGLALDINDMTQVLKAIQKLTLSRANPFADIKSDGAAAISTALTNLGLGEGSALPVGVPVPYPLAVPPAGWMKCNGSSFNLTSYPALAAVFPSGVLPDLRGEFIRGWDDGRGVDAGRGVLTSQSATVGSFYIQGSVYRSNYVYNPEGAVLTDAIIAGPSSGQIVVNNDEGNSSGTIQIQPADTRPRNIAFNYIVRAA